MNSSFANDCLPRERLEAISAGAAAAPSESAHLSACRDCAAALERIRAENQFVREVATVVRSKPASPQTPSSVAIPGYAILGEIRRGGQGAVYRATQLSTQREVAIKILHGAVLSGKAGLARFEREVEILARLDHPHIVGILDSGRIGDNPYLIMDLVRGVPLDEYARSAFSLVDVPATGPASESGLRRSSFSNTDLRALLTLFASICEAVNAAHLHGVIHRDLKPANVLVDAAGEPRVLDFGLARQAHTESSITVTREANFVGTLRWASPEQTLGEPGRIDLRTDVYSLGLILHWLLTGATPFAVSGSVFEIIERIRNLEIARPSLLRRGIDCDLDTIALRCLAKEPERRYETAGALARDVRNYLAGAPLDARRDSAWYVLTKHLSRHRNTVAASAAFAFVLGAAALAGTYFAARASEAGQREALERRLRQEQILRARAVALVLGEVVPPKSEHADTAAANWLDGKLLNLREALDTGWLGDQPELAGQVQAILSDIYADRGTNSGWYGEAAAHEASRLIAQAYGESDPRALRMAGVEVAAHLARRRLVEAERGAASLAARWAALGQSWRQEAWSARVLLARAQLLQNRPDEAEATARAVLDESAAVGEKNSGAQAASWTIIAEILKRRTQLEEAREAFVQAIHIQLDLARDTSTELTDALLQLGQLLRQERQPLMSKEVLSGDRLVDLALALQKLDAAQNPAPLAATGETLVALKRALNGRVHGEVAESMALLGRACLASRDYQASAIWYESAAETLAQLLPKPDRSVANCFTKAAECQMLLFNPAKAVELEKRALAILESLPDSQSDVLSMAMCRRDLATHMALSGDCESAGEQFAAALAAFESQLGSQGHVVATTHTRYADALLRCGQTDLALLHARQGYEMGVDLASTPGDQREQQLRGLLLASVASGCTTDVPQVLARYDSLVIERTGPIPEIEIAPVQAWLSDAAWTRAIVFRALGEFEASERWAESARFHWECMLELLSKYDARVARILPPWSAFPIAALR